MEAFRKTLDDLMGKNRNLPLKEQIIRRKHFDDPEVCKFFLIGFVPTNYSPMLNQVISENVTIVTINNSK